jgi:hypothetical protein
VHRADGGALQYMRWAGVEKMLVYDSFWAPEERQLKGSSGFCAFEVFILFVQF